MSGIFDDIITEEDIINFELITEAEKKKRISIKCFKQFGEYLFGEFGSFYGGYPMEKDTAKEKALFHMVKDFVYGNYTQNKVSGALGAALVKGLKNLRLCMKDYPEILKPDTTTLYRGTRLPFESKTAQEIVDQIDSNIIDRLKPVPDIMKFPKNVTYNPRSEVQSWSSKRKSAMNFIKEYQNMPLLSMRIVFKKTFPESELLFSTKFMMEMEKLALGSDDEYEVFRIGKGIKGCQPFMTHLAVAKIIETYANNMRQTMDRIDRGKYRNEYYSDNEHGLVVKFPTAKRDHMERILFIADNIVKEHYGLTSISKRLKKHPSYDTLAVPHYILLDGNANVLKALDGLTKIGIVRQSSKLSY